MERRIAELTVRVLIRTDHGMLLVRHAHQDSRGMFWCLPGGGVEPGESLTDTAQREVLEETGLNITVGALLAVWELSSRNRIEFVFAASVVGGAVTLGHDPEVATQHLTEVAWHRAEALVALELRPGPEIRELAGASAPPGYVLIPG